MRISKMTLKEFGPFKDATFDFPANTEPDSAEIHILTGPNGSGKSSALYALAALFGGPEQAIARVWGGGGEHISFHIETEHNKWETNFNPHFFQNEIRNLNKIITAVSRDARSIQIQSPHGKPGGFSPPLPQEALNRFCFAYAGNRHNEYPPLESILTATSQNSGTKLFFDSPMKSNDIVQWIANNRASEAIEIGRNQVAALRHANALGKLNKALNTCIGKEVSFDLSTSPLRLLIIVDGVRLDLNVLPDGLKSILGWLGDLLMRLDQLNSDPELDSLSQPFTLLLDEIDIHLHPSWQRRLLPMIQKLFPNAQIFCSTHSPFVVNSVDGAWVHAIELDGPFAKPQKPVRTQEGQSYATVLRQIFDTPQRFGPDVEQKLAEFYQLRSEVLKGDSGRMAELEALAHVLANISIEVSNIVMPELRQLSNAIRREAAS